MEKPDPTRSIPIFHPGERLVTVFDSDESLYEEPLIGTQWMLRNEFGGELVYRLGHSPPGQYLVYLICSGFFNVAPVIRHDNQYYSLEVDPRLVEETLSLEELKAEELLYGMLFQDYDHVNSSFEVQPGEVRRDALQNYLAYRSDDGERYAYVLFDFSIAELGILDKGEFQEALARFLAKDTVHPRMLQIIEAFRARYGTDEGREHFRAIIRHVRFCPEDGERIYAELMERLDLIEAYVRELLEVPQAATADRVAEMGVL